MVGVDVRDHDYVGLHEHTQIRTSADPFQLILQEDGCTFLAGVSLSFPQYGAVYLRPDRGIGRIYGHGHEPHSETVEPVRVLREGETVGRYAQCEVRVFFLHKCQGLEGLLIGQRVSRTGYAQDLQVGDLFLYVSDFGDGLFGAEDLAGDAGAGFVAAVEFAVAVIALDVAFGGHWDMHAGVLPVGFFVIAGMGLEGLFEIGVHMIHPLHIVCIYKADCEVRERDCIAHHFHIVLGRIVPKLDVYSILNLR